MLLALTLNHADATVLQDLDFPALVSGSRLIFVGSVQSQRQEVQGNLVLTYVTFSVETTYKGDVTTPTLELSFVGGQGNTFNVQVQGQFIPPIGMRAVFFIEKPDRQQVNPLTGWQQGYFPLTKGPDGLDYLDMRLRPDLAIPGLVVDPLVTKMQGMGFSADAINAKVPRAYLFSLDDFRLAVIDELQAQGAATP